MAKLQLLSDQEISIDDTGKREDGLGFGAYSKVLGNAALGTPGPFNVGIFGEWGTGKTSLMKLTQKYLRSQKSVVTVWFNAWCYEKEDHPIIPLLATIIREIELNNNFRQKMFQEGNNFIRALRAVAYGFSAKSTVKIPGFAEVEASFVAKDMIDQEQSLSQDPLLSHSLYYEAFEHLSSLNMGAQNRIVVFVDDLDRCFPDMAIKLLESIKLVLSQPGFIFFIGVARSVIEGYLQYRYEHDYGLKDFEGNSYLDKIIQLPFHIPPHTERVKQFTQSIVKQLNKSDQSGFSDILPTIAASSGGNPRAIVRFVNNLLIDRAINQALNEDGDMELIPIGFFAVTRILQHSWKEVFFLLVKYPDLAATIARWSEEDIKLQAASQDAPHEIVTSANVLLNDRELITLLKTEYGRAWLTNEEKRIESVSFLTSSRKETIETGKPPPKYTIIFYDTDPDENNSFNKWLSDAVHKTEKDMQYDHIVPIHPNALRTLAMRILTRKIEIIIIFIGGRANATREAIIAAFEEVQGQIGWRPHPVKSTEQVAIHVIFKEGEPQPIGDEINELLNRIPGQGHQIMDRPGTPPSKSKRRLQALIESRLHKYDTA